MTGGAETRANAQRVAPAEEACPRPAAGSGGKSAGTFQCEQRDASGVFLSDADGRSQSTAFLFHDAGRLAESDPAREPWRACDRDKQHAGGDASDGAERTKLLRDDHEFRFGELALPRNEYVTGVRVRRSDQDDHQSGREIPMRPGVSGERAARTLLVSPACSWNCGPDGARRGDGRAGSRWNQQRASSKLYSRPRKRETRRHPKLGATQFQRAEACSQQHPRRRIARGAAQYVGGYRDLVR